MNWRHRPPRSTLAVFRFLFAMSRFIFAFCSTPSILRGIWLAAPPWWQPVSASTLQQLPLSPAGVILLIPEDRGAHRQESKAYPPRSAVLNLCRPQCYSWTSKARPASKEATRGTFRSAIHPLPILLLAFGNNPDWSLRIGL